jgi:transcriptional regulator with XRE-family HTH domain
VDLNEAVRKLRELTGDSQQAFATRLKLSIRAIVNYEKDRTPSPKALAAMAHLASKHEAWDLANLFWDNLPEELQSIPVVRLPEGATIEEGKVIYGMLPKPGPLISQCATDVQLNNVRTPIMVCVRSLDALISGTTPEIDGPPADVIRHAIHDLKTVVKMYGQTVRIVPAKRKFAPIERKADQKQNNAEPGDAR